MKKFTPAMRMIVLVSICGALAIFSSTISKSLLSLFSRSMGATDAQVGLIASASTIPGILISYIAGDMADRFGYKKIMVGSLLIFATAPFLYLVLVNPLQLGIARFYHGFATAAFGPVAMATIAAFSGKNTGQNLSLYSSATLVGRALAPIAAGAASDAGEYYNISWHIPVYVIAAVAGVLALTFALWFFSKPVGEEDKEAALINKGSDEKIPFWTKLFGLFRYKPLLFVGIFYAFIYFAHGAFEMIFPLFAVDLGMSKSQIGAVMSVQMVGTIFLKPFFGKASDKFGRLPLIVIGLVISAGVFFSIVVTRSVMLLGVLIVVYGMGFAIITASMSALAADVAKEGQLGASLGVLSTLMDVGQTIGPPTVGVISGLYGNGIGIGFLGLLLSAAILFSLFAFRKQPDAAA
ncbi:MAG: MFS transporter [Clostridiales bacterium]|nr:MFS transporter [Clostridiales bacterium]